MAKITPYRKDAPGQQGLRFRIHVEPGERAVASFGLFGPSGPEISHRFVTYGEGEHDLSIDQVFPGQDLNRLGLSVTYVIGEEGIEEL